MEVFKPPVGEELERRFKLLSRELQLFGLNSRRTSLENLRSRYTTKGYSHWEMIQHSKPIFEEVRHDLDLGNMDIEVFPINSLIEFDPLSLNMVRNKISELPKEISNLRSIEELHLGMNKLTSLPHTIAKLGTLKVLTGHNNKLSSLPSSFSNFQNLHTLDLRSNSFQSLPESIEGMNLIELNFHNNPIKSIPEWLENITSLSKLDFRGTKIHEFPDVLYQLPNLKELHIGKNDIEYPERIGELEKHEWNWDPQQGAYSEKFGKLVLIDEMGAKYQTTPFEKKIVMYYYPGTAPQLRTTYRV